MVCNTWENDNCTGFHNRIPVQLFFYVLPIWGLEAVWKSVFQIILDCGDHPHGLDVGCVLVAVLD